MRSIEGCTGDIEEDGSRRRCCIESLGVAKRTVEVGVQIEASLLQPCSSEHSLLNVNVAQYTTHLHRVLSPFVIRMCGLFKNSGILIW